MKRENIALSRTTTIVTHTLTQSAIYKTPLARSSHIIQNIKFLLSAYMNTLNGTKFCNNMLLPATQASASTNEELYSQMYIRLCGDECGDTDMTIA